MQHFIDISQFFIVYLQSHISAELRTPGWRARMASASSTSARNLFQDSKQRLAERVQVGAVWGQGHDIVL
jgi:hypothetical protein